MDKFVEIGDSRAQTFALSTSMFSEFIDACAASFLPCAFAALSLSFVIACAATARSLFQAKRKSQGSRSIF